MTSGGQCVMTSGMPLMLLWSANSWDTLTLEVSQNVPQCSVDIYGISISVLSILQLDLHIAMLTLVLVPVPSSWMMSSVLQVLAGYWIAPVDQSYLITVFTLLMLVWDVKVWVFV